MPRSRRALTLAVALAATIAAPAAAATLEFVSPRHLATAIGPTAIELRVAVAAGEQVERLELAVDGQPLTTLTAPPWRFTWDAGDGSRGHRIVATLVLRGGQRVAAGVRTSLLQINSRVEVDLVSLYPLVRDAAGHYVTGLSAADFVVLEDGRPQAISRFTAEQRPLRVGVVLDVSFSMSRGGRLESAKKAALGFLDVLRPTDEGLVMAFSDEVAVLQDVTTDATLLARAIESTEAQGGTALYDAVYRGARQLEAFDGRRVMVLLSDGRDEAADGFGPGSLHTLEEAATQALRSEVMIFVVGLGKNLDRELAREWTRIADSGGATGAPSLRDVLDRIGTRTGGRLLLSPGAGQLRRAFDEVADDLRNQYSIAYHPPEGEEAGRFRRVEVRVPGRPDVQVLCREGYYDDASAR